jgi:hypothetical protein
MIIYAGDLRGDHRIVTRHISTDDEIFTRTVAIDFISTHDDGSIVHVQGYYEDNGDEYSEVLDPDTELVIE